MVVDDNADILHIIKQSLEDNNNNYNVICASSGIRCLNLLNDNEIPDLILLDIMMPKMTGWETYHKIKENSAWSKIPVVFLTARTDKTAKNAGGFLGEDYIEKPFIMEDLKQRIAKVLKNDNHL